MYRTLSVVAFSADRPFLSSVTSPIVSYQDGYRILTLTERKDAAEIEIGFHLSEIVVFPGLGRDGRDGEGLAQKHRPTVGRSYTDEGPKAARFAAKSFGRARNCVARFETESKIEKRVLRADLAVQFFGVRRFFQQPLNFLRRLRTEKRLRARRSKQRKQ